MKLGQFLADKAVTEFEVVGTTYEVAESNGEKIAVLRLKNPIPMVEGSQSVSDDATNASERLTAWDVETVRVYQRDFDADGIDINEDGTGTVKTNLRLDVSNRGDVWLTSKSFAQFGREKRQENRNNRRSGILSKMNERKAQAILKKEEVRGPEVVAQTGG